MAVGVCVVLFGSRLPPASKRLLQVQRHSQRQTILQLPGHNLQAQRQTLLVQTQRTLGDGQPQGVDYTWDKKRRVKLLRGNIDNPGSREKTCRGRSHTSVGEVKGSEEWVVVFGCHSGV